MFPEDIVHDDLIQFNLHMARIINLFSSSCYSCPLFINR